MFYKIMFSDFQMLIRYLNSKGFRPLNPDLLFVLKQKVGKKFKTAPASHEKFVVHTLKTFKLAPTKYVEAQTEKFSTLLHSIFRLTGRGQSIITLCDN